MRTILVTVFKFDELSKEIQEQKIEEYLVQNEEIIIESFATSFFTDKGFMNITAYKEDYYEFHGVRGTLETKNLVLLNSFFSIPNFDKIESIDLDSGCMHEYCAQPEVEILGIPTEAVTELISRLEPHWKECCSEYITKLKTKIRHDSIKQMIINLDLDYLKNGSVVS